MLAPYRMAAGAEIVSAPTRQGIARLRLEPGRALIELAGQRVELTSDWITLSDAPRSLGNRHALPRARAPLVVARAHPTAAVALWCEPDLDRALPLLTLEPAPPLDAASLDAVRALERLGERLATALGEHRPGIHRALQVGHGSHRALLVLDPDRASLFVRPLFREVWQLRLEVRRDGTVLAPLQGGRGTLLVCRSRYAITTRGDWLRLDATSGGGTIELWLPWIASEDRQLLAERLGRFVDPDAGRAAELAPDIDVDD